jgi:hypothetical protein
MFDDLLQLKTLSREWPRIKNFRGFALTGWSRYDHFSVLCELLPVSIPSALLSLLVLQEQDMKEASRGLTRELKCQFESNHISLVRLDECEWKGRDLFVQISSLKFYQVRFILRAYISSRNNSLPVSFNLA